MKLTAAAIIVLTVFAVFPALASTEWELGYTWTPVPNALMDGGFAIDSVSGYHVGYADHVFYCSWDVLNVPEFMTMRWADAYASGYLNLLDAGIRLEAEPFIVFAEAGINTLFVHGEGFNPRGFGANLRAGVGVRFDWWGISVAGTSVFPSWQALGDTVSALWSPDTRPAAMNTIQAGLFPSVILTWYLK